MEQLATPGTILLPPATLELAEGYVAVHSRGAVPIKGLAEPVEVFEVTGAGPARTRLQASAARGLTRFVGRDAEVEQLRQALEQARQGRGQLMALVGAPGVGKSRLVYEFTRSHRTRGWLIIESGPVSYGKATPYLHVIDLMKSYFKVDARDDSRAARAKVTGNILALDAALEDAVAPLLWLLEALPADDPFLRLDPPDRSRRTVEALRRVLLRESRVQPLLLVFEDLHWVDSETQAFLDALVESLPTAAVLLAVNYRPEYRHGWGNKTYYRQLRIDPLPSESAAELLGALVGNDPSVQPLERLLIERAQGNPFFLEENVRALVETRALLGKPGAYRLAKPVADVQVPATVHAVLAARIDRLSADDKGLLQTAAVIGKDVPLVLLQAVAALPEDAVRRGLADLQAAEFLYETRLFPDVEHAFKHALTHEVAYASLLQERRRALHARIVDAIERHYPDRLAEHVEPLAHHSARGEVWAKAVSYLRQAGLKAVERSAHAGAIANLNQALQLLEHLPADRARQELSLDIRLDLLAPLFAMGELDQRLARAREAATLAEGLDDARRLFRASIGTTNTLFHLGQTEAAMHTAQRCVTLAPALGNAVLESIAWNHLAQAEAGAGAYGDSVAHLRRSLATLGGVPARIPPGVTPLTWVLPRQILGLCLAALGEFQEASAVAAEAMRIAEALDHDWSRVLAYLVTADVAIQRGDVEGGLVPAARGLELSRTHLRYLVPVAESLHGFALVLSGRIEDGITAMEHALEAAREIRSPTTEPTRRGRLSLAYLIAGRPDAARDSARWALEFAEQHGQRGPVAWSLRALGAVATLHPSLLADSAEHYYEEAMRRADELGMRPLVAHCHLGLGRLYRRTGKREEAQEHLTTATTMYREMDMRFWLERAEAEMRQPE
jgi:tetratricopeptide (TPR) repeat protein